MNAPPKISGLLETSLYVEDMARSVDFFERVLHLVPMLRTERLTAFDAGQSGVLLVFKRGASLADMPSPTGTVPGHDGSGPLHMAFAIASDTYDEWRRELARHGVMIHSEVRWARGGRSLYFRDPDEHVLELATPGLWDNY
jgi:catechol 2,3-dioxygenase-like lactoylglutathione lyase family enzyme